MLRKMRLQDERGPSYLMVMCCGTCALRLDCGGGGILRMHLLMQCGVSYVGTSKSAASAAGCDGYNYQVYSDDVCAPCGPDEQPVRHGNLATKVSGRSSGQKVRQSSASMMQILAAAWHVQVKNARGEWITAAPVAGSFVCNVGDMLRVYSNGGGFFAIPFTVTVTVCADEQPTGPRKMYVDKHPAALPQGTSLVRP